VTGWAGETMRLRPERPWREHERLYRDLFADPAVAAALWPGAPGGARGARQSAEILAADIAHWQQASFGPWVFFETGSGMFIGRGGLRRCKLEGEESVELLYALRRDAWGVGYASEIAALSIAHARRIGLSAVVGFTATGNRASRRVLEKTGIRLTGSFEHAGVTHLIGRMAIARPARRPWRRPVIG
jgi:RimJ/RimL family protein N-acetyltransferase